MATLAACSRSGALPGDLRGKVYFVSDRDGRDAVFAKELPSGKESPFLAIDEPVGDPALSPDGGQMAFAMGGRIGLLALASKQTRLLTLGVDWKDSHPSWRPDGKALVVTSRRPDSQNHDVHLLFATAPAGGEVRQILTDTPGLDEASPRFAPGGGHVLFVRDGGVFRLEPGGRAHRLTAGFRILRALSLLPSGRLVTPWTEGKTFGLEAMDAEGNNRETLAQGPAFYRDVTPSPDGRYFAATVGYEADAMRLRQRAEIRLLDAQGRAVGALVRSWRSNNHSPFWGP